MKIAAACLLAYSCLKFTDEPASKRAAAAAPLPTIRVKGSDAMKSLMTDLAALYKGAHVVVEGGGTQAGFAALGADTADIAAASSRMDETAWITAEQKRHAHVIETPIGYNVVALYVSSANPITQLTVAQIADIMNGSITNWRKVGGPNAPIHIDGEAGTSGFTSYLTEANIAVKTRRDFADARGTVAAVAADPDAIGFAHPVPATPPARMLWVAKTDGGPAAAPTNATVLDGTYPVAGEVFLYTFDTSPERLKTFVAWTRSAAAQKAFSSAGYTQLRE